MSTEDDVSSQMQRLLPSSPTTTQSISVGESKNSRTPKDHHVDMKTSPDSKEVQKSLLNGEDQKLQSKDGDDTLSTFNPDKCYSWLKPPFDDVAVGKKGKEDGEASEASSESSSLPMPQAPDGGWGWLVVLGAFIILVICDGISYGFGVIYTELLVQFDESRSKTSLVGAIFFGVAMILGPLASALTTRYGCRSMTIFGGLLSSAGFMLSSFANSIDMLCFTFSVVVGVGFSFCYITSVVIVAFYFEKRRALATGLAVCGTGVGTFTFAPLMNLLLTEYGVRGLFFMLSAISLNLVVCGMLFRPLRFTESERWEMLLQEFNKIPYSREDIEMSRSRYPSDSSECDSDEEALDEEQRTLSVLSLPTFVNTNLLDVPSIVLMEALKNSKNPHFTLQRYMKNAMLQVDNFMPAHDAVFGSPVDDRTYAITVDNSRTDDATDSMPSSILDDNFFKPPTDEQPVLKISPPPTNVIMLKNPPAQSGEKVRVTSLKSDNKSGKLMSAPANMDKWNMEKKDTHSEPLRKDKSSTEKKETHTNSTKYDKQGLEKKETRNGILKHDSQATDKKDFHSGSAKHDKQTAEKKETNSKFDGKTHVKPADGLKDKDISQKRHEYSGMSNMLTNKGCEMEGKSVGKRLVGMHIGRHSALGIHLPLYRTDIFYRRLLKHNATIKHCTLGTSCPELVETVPFESGRGILCRKMAGFCEEAVEIMKGMIEFRLFLNPFFVVFVISNFIFYFWSDIPYMYSSDHAADNGIDNRRGSFLMSFIGIFNTVGQVVFGVIGDLKINLLNIYAIISSISGIFVALIPVLVHNYVGLCIMYSMFGFFISVSYPLTTVLLVNYLGVAKLTNAYGLLMLMQGIANLLGPPFAGWVSDTTGNYDMAFYLCGFFYALSGLILFCVYIPNLVRCAKKDGKDPDAISITIEPPPEYV